MFRSLNVSHGMWGSNSSKVSSSVQLHQVENEEFKLFYIARLLLFFFKYKSSAMNIETIMAPNFCLMPK